MRHVPPSARGIFSSHGRHRRDSRRTRSDVDARRTSSPSVHATVPEPAMNGESVLNVKFARVLVALTATIAIAACTETLDAGKSCPLLCPEQEIALRDTVIDAVSSDTTVLGIPPIGSETFLM